MLFFLLFPCVSLSCILAALFDTNVLCTKCSWEALDGSSFTNFWSISLQMQVSFPGGIFPHIIISALTSSAAKPLSHFCLYSYAERCRKIPNSLHWWFFPGLGKFPIPILSSEISTKRIFTSTQKIPLYQIIWLFSSIGYSSWQQHGDSYRQQLSRSLEDVGDWTWDFCIKNIFFHWAIVICFFNDLHYSH